MFSYSTIRTSVCDWYLWTQYIKHHWENFTKFTAFLHLETEMKRLDLRSKVKVRGHDQTKTPRHGTSTNSFQWNSPVLSTSSFLAVLHGKYLCTLETLVQHRDHPRMYGFSYACMNSCFCDLDLDLMTFVYEPIFWRRTCLTKMKFLGEGFQKLEHEQHRQTDRHDRMH